MIRLDLFACCKLGYVLVSVLVFLPFGGNDKEKRDILKYRGWFNGTCNAISATM